VLATLEIGERGAADPGGRSQGLERQSLPLPRRPHACAEADGDSEIRGVRIGNNLVCHELNFSSILEN
jgi:hypothetical protein